MIAGAPTSRWLAVVTAAPPLVRCPADLARLPGCADIVELRLDLLLSEADASVAEWVEASPRPVLATVRSTAETGSFEGTPAEAAELLAEAANAGASWIDAEAGVVPFLPTLPSSARLVLSSHGWDHAGEDAPDGAARKVAVPVDSAAAWERAREERGPRSFAVPYGSLGMARAACVSASPTFVFGAADEASAVIAGQPPLRRLLDELRLGEVTQGATLFGLVGTPPAWSPSPAMHNAVFRAEGRDALYVPLPDVMLEHALTLPLEGISVTTPGKRDAYQVASALDEAARRTGAVNTLFRDGGAWHGGNTDVDGVARAVPEAEAEATAFVFGAGGFARAAVVALKDRGYVVRLGARDDERGARAAWEIGVPHAGRRFERLSTDRVFVNATPAGSVGEPLPFVTGADLRDLIVLDAPYANDRETTIVSLAQGARRVVDGRDLLVAQAISQARMFGSQIPDDELEEILGLAARPPENLWLLGLRGAGKTTVGREVAKAAGRPFVDLDEQVERIDGRSIAEIVAADGWDAFRALEHQALERVVSRRGLVVATGGGVVDDDRNVTLLGSSGIRIWLDVDPKTAARHIAEDDARPRLFGAKDAGEESELAYSRRHAKWETLATQRIGVDDDVPALVAETSRAWATLRRGP